MMHVDLSKARTGDELIDMLFSAPGDPVSSAVIPAFNDLACEVAVLIRKEPPRVDASRLVELAEAEFVSRVGEEPGREADAEVYEDMLEILAECAEEIAIGDFDGDTDDDDEFSEIELGSQDTDSDVDVTACM